MAEDPKTPPPGAVMPTEEEMLAALRQEIGFTLATLVGALAPRTQPEILSRLIEVLVTEQLVVQTQIFPAFLDPAVRVERKTLWVVVKGPDGTEGRFSASKEIDPKDPGAALMTVLMLTFLLNAGVRGLLRLWGYDYRFVEPKPKDTRIIM